jgi:hypothetical protein
VGAAVIVASVAALGSCSSPGIINGTGVRPGKAAHGRGGAGGDPAQAVLVHRGELVHVARVELEDLGVVARLQLDEPGRGRGAVARGGGAGRGRQRAHP